MPARDDVRVELRPDYPVLTARLRLRPLSVADADALVRYRSLPEVCRYVPFEPMDHSAVLARIDGSWGRPDIRTEGDALTLGVELAATGRLVGDVVLFFVSALHRGGEIGWIVNPEYAGRGYATEATHGLLHLAFDQLGLHRVSARIDARNTASLALADRLGMRREAHLVRNEWFKGGWSDEIDTALLEEEWAGQHPAGPGSCRWSLRPAR